MTIPGMKISGTATDTAPDYFTARGLLPTAAENLNASLRLVLDSMPALLYGEPSAELTAEEQAVLAEGGVDVGTVLRQDPIAEMAVQYAALVESSLSIKEFAQLTNKTSAQVRQMIARRTLYSILLDNRRYIPMFQLTAKGALIPDITKVNVELSPDLHPIEVFEWYTMPDPDLFKGEDVDQTISPIQWLVSGYDYKTLVTLARRR